ATPHAEAFRALESEPPDGLVVSNWTSNWIRRQSNFDFALHRWVPVTHPWGEYGEPGGFDVFWGEPPKTKPTHSGLCRQDHQGRQPNGTAYPAPIEIRVLSSTARAPRQLVSKYLLTCSRKPPR